MPYNPIYQRNPFLRLKNYDYSKEGAYFVTICVCSRANVFGSVVDGQMRLTASGKIAHDVWEALPQRFTGVDIDHFVIMPNHMHGIVVLTGDTVPDEDTHTIILGKVIRAYKAVTTLTIRRTVIVEFAWQANYYEHIVRIYNPHALEKIRLYIENNPSKWGEDEYYRK